MRLQKFMAAAGLCSRREAENRIRDGRVTVNGCKAQIGTVVEENDLVTVDGVPICLPERHTYVLLHKPRGYVTTLRDEKGRPTVAELVAGAGVRLFPVGRLDFFSEGLLLMTDDGEAANRLAHPSHGVKKTYRVWVTGPEPEKQAALLRQSIEYEGVRYRAADVSILQQESGKAVIDVTVGEGKYHEVRNMCAYAGLKVQRLLRIRQGSLELGRLPAGKWRFLTDEEIKTLLRT